MNGETPRRRDTWPTGLPHPRRSNFRPPVLDKNRSRDHSFRNCAPRFIGSLLRLACCFGGVCNQLGVPGGLSNACGGGGGVDQRSTAEAPRMKSRVGAPLRSQSGSIKWSSPPSWPVATIFQNSASSAMFPTSHGTPSLRLLLWAPVADRGRSEQRGWDICCRLVELAAAERGRLRSGRKTRRSMEIPSFGKLLLALLPPPSDTSPKSQPPALNGSACPETERAPRDKPHAVG